MKIETSAAFFEKIFAEHGKIIALPAKSLPKRIWRSAGGVVISENEILPRKSIFENIAAPLAATGTPWEIARERIERELDFWFGAKETPGVPQTLAEDAEPLRVALAAALAAKPEGAPVIISGKNLSGKSPLLTALRERASQENFAVVIQNADYLTAREADWLAFMSRENESGEPEPRDFILCTPEEAERNPETLAVAKTLRRAKCGQSGFADNTFDGQILDAGAGEFFAEIFAGTQIRGKLCGSVPDEENISEGTAAKIFLQPEVFHLDAFPPEENYFELCEGGEIFCDGHLYFREFKICGNETVLRVAALHRQSLEIPDGGTLYAWFFPEDALGFLVNN